jgi:Protein of unknown function (DUF3105)
MKWGSLVSAGIAGLTVVTMAGLGVTVLVDVSFSARAKALPCSEVPGTPEPFEGNRHIPYDGAPHAPYKTKPPTSGPHSPRIVAPGIYREEIPEELQVHALEHGHVIIQYRPGLEQSDVDALERIGRSHPRDVIVAPYFGIDSGIALTGWQRLQLLPAMDEPAIERFIETVAGRYNHAWLQGATSCV